MKIHKYTTLKPWYGAWPPKVYKGRGNIMKERQRSYSRLTIIMGVILLGGIAFLFASYSPLLSTTETKNLGSQLAHDLGIALIIASFLGASVDIFLRRQLADDAFKASIGYLLPDELKDEMQWIYNAHVLCIEHDQTCELYPIDGTTCRLQVKIIRKFRNISSSNEIISLGVAVDEWFDTVGQSKILSFGYKKLETTTDQFQTEKVSHALKVKEQKISLAPEEEITVWLETEEIKKRNDEQIWNFGTPTLNPKVSVNSFNGISIEVGFGYRSSPEKLGTNTYRLKGTLLPSQILMIRWWEQAKDNEWLGAKDAQ
jgi:hypothetical protein